MNNNTHNVRIRLQDGKSTLTTWEQQLAAIPTIGESINVRSGAETDGRYQPQAIVSKIDHDLKTGDIEVTAEVVPLGDDSKRNTVFLNAAYVPENLRTQVETLLRNHFDVPVFEWQESPDPTPLLEIHGGKPTAPAELNRLRNQIKEEILKHSELSFV
jgi:hypothetical protein